MIMLITIASCSKSAAAGSPSSNQADIRMHLHRLLRLDDNQSAASCQHAGCKLIVKNFYPQAWHKLFQQLKVSSCNKSDFHRLAATWWSQQTCCNLLTTCSKPLKSTTCSKSVAFLVPKQGIQTHSYIGLMTARQQVCSKLALTRMFLAE